MFMLRPYCYSCIHFRSLHHRRGSWADVRPRCARRWLLFGHVGSGVGREPEQPWARCRSNSIRSGGELKATAEARSTAEKEVVRLNEQLKQQELQFAQQLKQQEQQWNEKLELLAGARVELSNQFKTLASEILEEKTKRFTEQNQTNLSQLLTPLAEKIKSFQQKVEEVYVQEGKDRSALSEQVRLLMGLNQQISAETGN